MVGDKIQFITYRAQWSESISNSDKSFFQKKIFFSGYFCSKIANLLEKKFFFWKFFFWKIFFLNFFFWNFFFENFFFEIFFWNFFWNFLFKAAVEAALKNFTTENIESEVFKYSLKANKSLLKSSQRGLDIVDFAK